MTLYDKKISMVLSDLDGTIIKEGENEAPQEFFDMANKIIDSGIPFVAASGRQYANIRRILAPIADRINYICENGCLVVYNDKVIDKSVIDRELAMELIADMQQQPGTEIMISGEHTGYFVTDNLPFLDMVRTKIKYNCTALKDFHDIPEDIIKMSIYWETGIPEGPKQWFREKYGTRLLVADGGNGWLDFNALGSGKGKGLRVLSKHTGIPTSEMIAFGDNENDITMLQEAGISFAMATAKPHVQKEADYICDNVVKILAGLL